MVIWEMRVILRGEQTDVQFVCAILMLAPPKFLYRQIGARFCRRPTLLVCCRMGHKYPKITLRHERKDEQVRRFITIYGTNYYNIFIFTNFCKSQEKITRLSGSKQRRFRRETAVRLSITPVTCTV